MLLSESFERTLIDERIEKARMSDGQDFADHYILTATPQQIDKVSAMFVDEAEVDSEFTLFAVFSSFTRPSLLVSDHSFETPESEEWAMRLDANRASIDAAIPPVGQVLRSGTPLGTAFLIGEELAITNRHVALLFAEGQRNDARIRSDSNGSPFVVEVEFLAESGSALSDRHRLLDIIDLSSADGPDLALLRLESAPDNARPLLLGTTPPPQTAVIAIGYPSSEEVFSPAMRERIQIVFGDIFNVKRASPGKIGPSGTDFLAHDCSTLGGSSGSPVVDIETGLLLGVHARATATANNAVTAEQVRAYIAAVGV